MQLKVSSVALSSKIIPVDWMVYDLDAQPGINAPIISEVSATKEMLANMGQHSGSSINMTTSAGQQVVGNISRGLIQGVSGYFSKKLRTPRIHLKNGYQVFLIQKKQ